MRSGSCWHAWRWFAGKHTPSPPHCSLMYATCPQRPGYPRIPQQWNHCFAQNNGSVSSPSSDRSSRALSAPRALPAGSSPLHARGAFRGPLSRSNHFRGPSVAGRSAGPRLGLRHAPPPSPRTKWTRRVPHPVLIGHVSSLTWACAMAHGVSPAQRKRSGSEVVEVANAAASAPLPAQLGCRATRSSTS